MHILEASGLRLARSIALRPVWLTFHTNCDLLGWPRFMSGNLQITLETSFQSGVVDMRSSSPLFARYVISDSKARFVTIFECFQERLVKGKKRRSKVVKPRMLPSIPSVTDVKTKLRDWMRTGVSNGSLPPLNPYYKNEFD